MDNPNCPEANILKSLPDFINKTKCKTCILCHSNIKLNIWDPSEDLTSKILKELCLQSILPFDNKVLEESQIPDSFPFCKECTKPILKLGKLYKELQVIQSEFETARNYFAENIINSYVQIKGQEEDLKEKTLEYWKLAIRNFQKYPSFLKNCEQDELDLLNVDLSFVKVEEESNSSYAGDNEPEEFISPENKQLIHTNQLYPIVKVERLNLRNECNDDKEDNLDTISNISISDAEYDSYIEDDDFVIDSDDDEESALDDQEKNFPQTKDVEDFVPDPADSEDDYKPSCDLKIPASNGMVTRKRSKQLSSDKISLVKLEIKSESETSSEDNFIVSRKRKYIKSFSNPKKPKISGTKIKKKSEGCGENQVPKVKAKRIYKAKKRVPCKICGKHIQAGYNLLLHNRTHTGEKPFKCPFPLCTMTFYKPSNLTVHLCIHNENHKRYICNLCDGKFSEKSILKTHKASKHLIFESDLLFKCELCLRQFLRPKEIADHKKTIHNPNKKKNRGHFIHCSICLTDFTTVEELNLHEKTEEHKATMDSKLNIHCLVCKLQFTSVEDLQIHLNSEEHSMSVEQARIDNLVFCKICNLKFDTKEKLMEHRKTNEHVAASTAKKINQEKKSKEKPEKLPKLPKKKKIKKSAGKKIDPTAGSEVLKKKPRNLSYYLPGEKTCNDCHEKFPTLGLYRKHRQIVHPRTKDWQCEICGSSFTDSGNLSKHRKTHDPESHYKCNECGEVFKNLISLNCHTPKHTGKWDYRCEHCDEGFCKIRSYSKHLCEIHAEVHLKEKPAICKVCFNNFATEDELKEHIQKFHLNLICSYCGRLFGIRQHLIKHVRIHTLERPFICTVPSCKKSFTQKVNLKEHMYRHSGERPFHCKICEDAGFFRRKELQNHMEKLHPLEESINNESSQINKCSDNLLITSNVSASDFPTVALEEFSSL